MQPEESQMNLPTPQTEVNETDVENPQDGIDLSNDELAAAMGFMTTLGDQQMQAEQQQVEEQNEAVAQEEQAAETETEVAEPVDPEAIKEEVKGDLMKEVRKVIKEELGDMKKMIKDAINEDGEE